jgi:hypothetical protein
MSRLLVLAFALACLWPCHAVAGEAADFTRRTLESGDLATGEAALAARVDADPGNNEARFGLGMVRFARGIENFGRAQYRHGLQAPRAALLPIFRLPLPTNPAPDDPTYETQRGELKALLDDFAKVETTLSPMSEAETKIVVDLDAVKFDFRGDGKPDVSETLGAVLAALGRPGQRGATPPPGAFDVKFDNSDAFWLRGYCRLLSAVLEFVLAYDWRETFDTSAKLFYPHMRTGPFSASDRSDGAFDDIPYFIVFIHEIRWRPIEPSRLRAARDDLKQTIAMSRASWKSILAETGDDREWIPGPQQKHGVVTSLPVTQAQVDAWLGALDDFDALLDGRKLLGHWRFNRGVNLERVFLEPRDFDLVLWLAGDAAIPYLEEGPTLTRSTWAIWNQVFGGNFLGYAAWFN